MARKCSVTGCSRFVFGGGFCLSHQHFRKDLIARKEKAKQKAAERSIHYSTFVNKDEMDLGKLRDILDKEFSIYMRRRRGDIVKCATCNATGHYKSFDHSHYIVRQHMATRWDERNGDIGCHICNRLEYGQGQKMREFLVSVYGEESVQHLETLGKTVKVWTRQELLDMIQFYRNLNKKFDQ